MPVNRLVLHARNATIPIKSKHIPQQLSDKDNLDFFVNWTEREVKRTNPHQRNEWKKIGKEYLKTVAKTARLMPVFAITLGVPTALPAPSSAAETISSLISLPLIWLMNMFLPKSPSIMSPAPSPETVSPHANQAIQQAAISVPGSSSIPYMYPSQQVPVPPPTHGAETLIPTPVLSPMSGGPDLTDISQQLLLFVINNGFYILLALIAATGIMKAFGWHTVAKKVAINGIKGIGILLLSTPAIVLMLYLIMFILGQFPGFHPPISLNR